MSQKNLNYDFVVVGAGVMGRSAALYLTLQYPQARCALIEQYKFDHGEGSSHSRIRIIRSAYVHPFYRDLCLEGIDKNWKQVEQLFNSKFIVENPFLAFIEDEDRFKYYLHVAETSTNIKMLSMEEVRQKFPSAPQINMKNPVFYDTKAGIVMAASYMSSVVEYLKKQKNIDIFQETEVISLKNNAQGASLELRRSNNEKLTIFAKKVALCCGRWIGKLAPVVNPVLKEVRQTITFWKMKQPEIFKVGLSPSWTHYVNGQDLYALPDAEGDGIKYGVHAQNHKTEGQFNSQEDFLKYRVNEVNSKIQKHYKDRYESMVKAQKCYYTVTKSEDFLIDWSDQHENILICSPCSGHGFKFGPILGKIVADLLEKDQSIEVFQKYRYLCRLFYHMGVNLE